MEIKNCGAITVESVNWAMSETAGRYLSDYTPRPYPRLEPGEGIRETLSLTIVREPLAMFTLTGVVDGRPYQTEKTVSGVAS